MYMKSLLESLNFKTGIGIILIITILRRFSFCRRHIDSICEKSPNVLQPSSFSFSRRFELCLLLLPLDKLRSLFVESFTRKQISVLLAQGDERKRFSLSSHCSTLFWLTRQKREGLFRVLVYIH